MNERFFDHALPLTAFTDVLILVCPACGGCAVSRALEGRDPPGWFNPRRLVCGRCGLSRAWDGGEITRRARDAHDDFFGLPLWLQTPCCGDVLWAYNAAHLEALEGYVSATLRTRRQDPDRGWANRSWTSRLPVWMKRASNREAVAAGLKRLRLRLPPPP